MFNQDSLRNYYVYFRGVLGCKPSGRIVYFLTVSEFEFCVDEPEEFLVDNPAEVSWLAELLHGASVDGPSVLPSSYWAG